MLAPSNLYTHHHQEVNKTLAFFWGTEQQEQEQEQEQQQQL